MIKDLILWLKPPYSNAYHHGWLAACFGRQKYPTQFLTDPSNLEAKAWESGYDDCIKSSKQQRGEALQRILELNFD